MPKRSAGLLVWRRVGDGIEVLLVHPGGPFWAKRDAGAWSIPKGEHGDDEDPLEAARREFAEETGLPPPAGLVNDLGEIRQKAGKLVRAFAIEGDADPAAIVSNEVEIMWPPRSGRRITIPEIDRAGWFAPGPARTKLLAAQQGFVDRLLEAVSPACASARAGKPGA